eukprot:CAMPEP_0170215218 /NCGR_PEP_ID=MMETSP0116_2-20130129/7244_1 /TAXON_ID=400756 /ORGANISM="Durinskia baltica, Strain CSIRO CS-38" /LENGTH=245 /DNA_ID=CAMNT_0010465791 /DNA_START=76 /DNA_END=810 /DNA_ORIENTATION=-
MAPLAELDMLAETAAGLAFVVRPGGPGRAPSATPERRRPPGSCPGSGEKLPRLLRATMERPSEPWSAEKGGIADVVKKASVERAGVAAAPAQRWRELVERAGIPARCLDAELRQAGAPERAQRSTAAAKDLQDHLAAAMAGAVARREAILDRRRQRARDHDKKVSAKVAALHERQAAGRAEQQRVLAQRMESAAQKRAEALAARKSKSVARGWLSAARARDCEHQRAELAEGRRGAAERAAAGAE